MPRLVQVQNGCTTMYGAGRCIRKNPSSTIEDKPIPPTSHDKNDKESVPQLQKIIDKKPALEQISSTLNSIKLKKKETKHRVNFEPFKKSPADDFFQS